MKKYILTIILAVGFGIGLNAQNQSSYSDGFFSSNYSEYREGNEFGIMPILPGHTTTSDQDADPAPIGSGLLLLAGMGLGYAIKKRRN